MTTSFTALHSWPPIARALLLALAYFVTGKLGLYFPTQDSHITLFWLPTGIAVAVLLRWETQACLIGIYAGALLIDLSLGTPFPFALIGALGNTLAPYSAVWLLKRWRFDPRFSRQYDLLTLLSAAMLGTLLPAMIGIAVLWFSHLIELHRIPLAWLHWWLGDVVSILLAGPLLLSFSRDSLKEFWRRPAELIICTVLLLIAGWGAFLYNMDTQLLPLAFVPIPFVLWAALRFGVTGATLSVLLLSFFTAIGTALDRGIFGALPHGQGMYLAWLYMFTISLIGLMVTTMLGERSRTEASLKQANDLLALAQRASQSGVWDWELASGKLTWSNEMFRLFGFDPENSEANFENWRKAVHPDDLEAAEKRIADTLRDNSPLNNQYRIVLPNGETRWIVALGNIVQNESGKPERMTGLCIDITGNVEIKQRMQHSESRYKAFLQQAADAMYIHDLEGHIVEINHQACLSLGYSETELCHMQIADISPGFDLRQRKPLWDALEPGQPVCFVSSHRRKDGSTFPVEIRLVALSVDHQKLIMALASDITQRVRIETELQESEMRYRNFAERLPLGIVITQEGIIKYFNQATQDISGYSAEELEEHPIFPFVYESDRAWIKDMHQRRMQGEKAPSPYVVRMIRKDGRIRQWEMHVSTIDWKGKRSGFGIFSDITERVELEEKLKKSLRQLEEKELAKTRFLAAAGHDLRQPVAAATLFVDALKLTAPNPRQSALIERLDQSMGVFSSLLERLLDISKFDAGLIKPQFATLDLTELFTWLELNFAQTALDKQLRFRMFFPIKHTLTVRTDIGLLQSVLMNLVTNAIKFTSRGGILIGARLRNNKVCLQVWDTGSGISQADMPYIFDEFYQANNPQRNREGGLGLGLSICQRAMSLLGGQITCCSRLGHGSVFELELPLNGERRKVGHILPGENAAGPLGETNPLQGKRIVVLEDDVLVANGMLDLLRGLGAEVRHFQMAEEALRYGDIVHADYFIVDFSLGGVLSGVDFLHAVQRGLTTPLAAVVITGETSSTFISDTKNLPWPLLHKPVNLAKLLDTLTRVRSR